MEYSNEIIQVLFIGSIGMILLTVSIILFVIIYQKKLVSQKVHIQELEITYQKNLLHTILETQEKERKKIAGDLHDDIGSIMTTLKLYIQQFPKSQNRLLSLELIDQALHSIRNISKELMPPTLVQFGLDLGIKELCKKVSYASPIKINYYSSGYDRKKYKLKEIVIYRIAQELINNAIKHSQASDINIHLTVKSNILKLIVIDDGKGFSYVSRNPKSNLGIGLISIESRVQLIGGQLDFKSLPNQGTCFTISIRLDK